MSPIKPIIYFRDTDEDYSRCYVIDDMYRQQACQEAFAKAHLFCTTELQLQVVVVRDFIPWLTRSDQPIRISTEHIAACASDLTGKYADLLGTVQEIIDEELWSWSCYTKEPTP